MEIQDIIQGLTSAEIAAITSPDERTLIVNETLNQAVIYVNGTFKQASFVNTDDIPEGVKKFATAADLAQITTNATNITTLQSSKEDAFTKNTAFNKDFGTSSGTVLEGNTTTITPSQASAISANSAKVSFPEAPNDGKQYARKNLAWAEVISSGTGEPLPIINLSSTDNTTTISQSSATVLSWDVEDDKDTGFTHSNSTNNSRIEVDEDGTYLITANIRMISSNQRTQFVSKYLIDGVVQSQPFGSAYIRNSGPSSDFWTCVVSPPPVKLTAGQYVELQIQVESQTTTGNTGTFQGSDSNFSVIKLQGTQGEKGDTGSGSNIVVQKDDSTIGTLTDTLNFEGNVSVTDEGSNKTTVTVLGGGDNYYSQKSTNLNGGTINAAYGTPLECVPSSGTFEITVAETGSYIIFGRVNIGTNLGKDNGAIELIYGIDTGGGASAGPAPYTQNQQAKKNKANGIQGTWGGVSLNAGDKVHLFLSTLSDSTTWTEGEIFIATWK